MISSSKTLLATCNPHACLSESLSTGGGGRSAIQLVNGSDAVTAAGGGGAADCSPTKYCGGGGESLHLMDCHLASFEQWKYL